MISYNTMFLLSKYIFLVFFTSTELIKNFQILFSCVSKYVKRESIARSDPLESGGNPWFRQVTYDITDIFPLTVLSGP
jgi:hypothetical protein